MSNIDKQWLQQKIADMEATRDDIPFGLGEDGTNTLAALRIALASLEADASGRNPVLAYADSYRDMAKQGVESIPVWSVITDLERNIAPLYTTPPAPVSVPDGVLKSLLPDAEKSEFWFEHDGKILFEGVKFNNAVFDACRAAMLQGAEPVTNKDDGGRSEQDDSPECGWVVTHSGKDYFYREQKDAVTHMNSAVESGIGVSLRSFIPEPITTGYRWPDGLVSCSELMPAGNCEDRKRYDVIDDDDDVILSAITYNEAQAATDGYNDPGGNFHIVEHDAAPKSEVKP